MSPRYIPPALRRQSQDENQNPAAATVKEAGHVEELPTRKLEDLNLGQEENKNTSLDQVAEASELPTRSLEDLKTEQDGKKDSIPAEANETPETPTSKIQDEKVDGSPKKTRDNSRRFASRDIRYYNKSGKGNYDNKGHLFFFFVLGIKEIYTHFAGAEYSETTRSTLNNSIEHPEELAYVMLFPDANPRWKSDQIIFAKTNIEFLPGYEEAYAATPKGDDQLNDVAENDEPGGSELASFDAFVAEVRKEARERDAREKEARERESQANDGQGDKSQQEKTQATVDQTEGPVNQIEETVDQTEAAQKDKSQQEEQVGDQGKELHEGQTQEKNILPGGTKENKDHIPTKPDDQPEELPEAAQSGSAGPELASAIPIAVFEQTGQRRLNLFRFLGWYNLAQLAFLQPKSPKLVKMLAQKWDIRDKYGKLKDVKCEKSAWTRSMAMRWTVIKMSKMGEQPEPPAIDHLAKDGVSIKRKGKQEGVFPGWEKLQDFEKWEKPKQLEQKYGGEETEPKTEENGSSSSVKAPVDPEVKTVDTGSVESRAQEKGESSSMEAVVESEVKIVDTGSLEPQVQEQGDSSSKEALAASEVKPIDSTSAEPAEEAPPG